MAAARLFLGPERALSISHRLALCISCIQLVPDTLMRWQDYISVDPAVCHGQACIRGTRIPVAVVLANLADGLNRDELLRSYPGLSGEAIQAALGYAAELAQE